MNKHINTSPMKTKQIDRLLINLILLGLIALAAVSCTPTFVTSEHTGVIVEKLGLQDSAVRGQYKYMYGFVVKEDNNPEKQIIYRPYDVYVKGDTLCWTITKRKTNNN